MSALCDLSAVELARLLARREASPVELLESCLARMEEINPRLNAVVALAIEGARTAAREAERRFASGEATGPLAGLPLGIKDLNDTAGLRTTYGSPLYADHVPSKDAGVVARLRAAGGIIAAKTNTPEFGAGANTDNAVYGFTGNPFDPEKTCAGSSGGSAVALATSMLPLCNGSDFGGSLRTPASFCGVVGLRPTPAVVANEVRPHAFSPLSVEGPMARSVADLALLLSALAGEDPADPWSRPCDPAALRELPEVELASLKVAFSEDLGFAPVSALVRRAFRERCQRLAPLFGAAADRDPDFTNADRVFEVLRGVNFLTSHRERLRRRPEALGPNVRANLELGLALTAEEIAWAHVEHGKIYRGFLGFLRGLDLLVAPGAAVTPFGRGLDHPSEIDGRRLPTYISWVAINYGLTLVAHPVLCLPCGLDEEGMPFGLQLVGHRFQERRLLAIGKALEQAMASIPECRRPLPDLASLACGGTAAAGDGRDGGFRHTPQGRS